MAKGTDADLLKRAEELANNSADAILGAFAVVFAGIDEHTGKCPDLESLPPERVHALARMAEVLGLFNQTNVARCGGCALPIPHPKTGDVCVECRA